MHRKQIPCSGEELPVIGCGTYRGFDVNAEAAAAARLQNVLTALFTAGGSVIDSSPMYGRAEAVTGNLLAGSKAMREPSSPQRSGHAAAMPASRR